MAYMLTTEDNPYDPVKQFDQWYAWDTQMGYNTCSYLARITKSVSDMGANEYEEAVTMAINQIMRYNLTGNYKVVTI